MFSLLSYAWNMLLDLLFPQKRLVRELEAADAADFASRAEKSEGCAGTDIISCFSYNDPKVRQAVWELKYRGNRKLAALLAACLYDELLAFLEEYAPLRNFYDPLLIPVPLSRRRERKRGFNQCELLCNELMRLDSGASSPPRMRRGVESSRRGGAEAGRNFTLSHALRKTKDTQSQTKQDTRSKRLHNLRGCFAADRAQVEGRNIILIDDVATTGATLEEARRALYRAGTRKVIAITVAH